jgi:hypothetical protein
MTDEELWSRYAAAAMTTLIETMEGDPSDADVAENVGLFADAMLAEHRERFGAEAAASVPAPAQAFKVGDRVRTLPNASWRTGEIGTVVRLDPPDHVVVGFDGEGRGADTRYYSDRLEHVESAPAQGEALDRIDALALDEIEQGTSTAKPGALSAIASRIRAALHDHAELRAELDEAHAVGRTLAAENEKLRTENARLSTELAEARGHRDLAVSLFSAQWDALHEEHDSARAKCDDLTRKLDEQTRIVREWRSWADKRVGTLDTDEAERSALDAKLAAAKAGPGLTERDVEQLRFMTPHLSTSHERCSSDFADRLFQVVQSREETER